VARYAFAFPFGNYTCVAPIRVAGEDIELILPVRSYTPEMPGYFMIGYHEKVQKGARRVYDMLRADQGFNTNDATILVSCINRRIVELMAGCKSGTEAEILKEGLLSTQVMGFLASNPRALLPRLQLLGNHTSLQNNACSRGSLKGSIHGNFGEYSWSRRHWVSRS
jgi:hypothetical protein